jgi:hypothetical protein
MTIRISFVDGAVKVIVDTIVADLGLRFRAEGVAGTGGIVAVDEAVSIIVQTIVADLGYPCDAGPGRLGFSTADVGAALVAILASRAVGLALAGGACPPSA